MGRSKEVINIRGINRGEALLLKCEENNSKIRRKLFKEMTGLMAHFYAL